MELGARALVFAPIGFVTENHETQLDIGYTIDKVKDQVECLHLPVLNDDPELLRMGAEWIHPLIDDILEETQGIIVYQEQVMQIAVQIAGFSLAKADTLRKAMGKKKHEIIDREGENFISGAAAKGHPKDKARQLWNQIVPFAKYGFNRSHSAAYSVIAYQTAYLKAHYPQYFMCAMLNSFVGNAAKLAQILAGFFG